MATEREPLESRFVYRTIRCRLDDIGARVSCSSDLRGCRLSSKSQCVLSRRPLLAILCHLRETIVLGDTLDQLGVSSELGAIRCCSVPCNAVAVLSAGRAISCASRTANGMGTANS